MSTTKLIYGAAFVLAVIGTVLLALTDANVSLPHALAFLGAALACVALAPVVA